MSAEHENSVLPNSVSARKSVQKGAVYRGHIPREGLPALASAVEDYQLNAAAVAFSQGESGESLIAISAKATVTMECQRCLRAAQLKLDVDGQLTVVAHDEEARHRLGELEPIVLDSDEVDLHDLVDQELCLALPSVALHLGEDEADCRKAVDQSLQITEGDAQLLAVRESERAIGSSQGETRRPFAQLDKLLAESEAGSTESVKGKLTRER